MNLCLFIGRLTRDPEVRYTQSGKAVVNLGLAVDGRRYKDSKGEMVKETEFVDLEAWDTHAETIGKFSKKGDRLQFTTNMKTDKWEKDGQKHSAVRFKVNGFEFLDKKGDKGAVVEENTNSVETSVKEEDIPF